MPGDATSEEQARLADMSGPDYIMAQRKQMRSFAAQRRLKAGKTSVASVAPNKM